MLTIDQLKQMQPNEIFASGYGYIKHPWFSLYHYARKEHAYKTVDENGLTKVKWVAARGGIHDWAIYHSLDANLELADYLDGDSHLERSFEDVYHHGAKLCNKEKIKEFIPCDDEAFDMYRY